MYRNGDAGVYVQDSAGNQIVGNTPAPGVRRRRRAQRRRRHRHPRQRPAVQPQRHRVRRLRRPADRGQRRQRLVQQAGFALGNGHDIVVRGNTANRTGSSGISLEGGEFAPDGVTPIGPALVEGNTANENLDDGISVAAGGHTVTDNNAHNNAGYGIASDELNVDGGGNRASGNGRPEQCLGVVCNLNDNVPLTHARPHGARDDRSSRPAGRAQRLRCDVHVHRPPTTPRRSRRCRSSAASTRHRTRSCRSSRPSRPSRASHRTPTVPETEGWEECSSPHFYPQFFEAGDHHFEVRASDHADNQDLTPESLRVDGRADADRRRPRRAPAEHDHPRGARPTRRPPARRRSASAAATTAPPARICATSAPSIPSARRRGRRARARARSAA